MTRLPAVAGLFYPAEKDKLKNTIKIFLAKARPDFKEKPKALIVPHAGYIYSGLIAAYGFKTIESYDFKEVILLGPSHHFPFYGLALDENKFWQTPLKKTPLFEKKELLKEKEIFFKEKRIHQPEHSLEVELPFLQTVLRNFKIMPLLTGTKTDITKTAKILSCILKNDSLLVVSSDLSHYLPYNEAKKTDLQTINYILNKDVLSFLKNGEACGKIAILILLYIAKALNWQSKLLIYANSGDTAGPKNQVVGYTAIAFYPESQKATVVNPVRDRTPQAPDDCLR